MAYVIGYIFDGGTYCNDECLTEVLIRRGRLSPAARMEVVADNLDRIVEVEALDYHEQRDSLTIPQPVDSRSDDLVGDTCDECREEIDPAPDGIVRCPACGALDANYGEEGLCPRCAPFYGVEARRAGRVE